MRAFARVLGLATMGLGLPAIGPAHAADPRNPDWPCVQAKVPEMSVAAVWAGPPLDDVGNKWESDAQVKDVVSRLAARRTPVEEAQKIATDFLAGSGDARQERAKLVFAGLFDTLNRLRSEVINGIERYTRRQREFAERIRADTLRLRTLQDQPGADQKEVEQLGEQLQWDTRIFEDRRRTIGYVCEVPVVIEQRLFALGRTIQQGMEQ
jgi:hypothetical protein